MQQTQPYRVGLTGGIASGKSAAAAEFAKLGVPIIDTDMLAREVVAPGTPALQAIVAHFGAQILNAEGQLDRARMRQRIFQNLGEKQALEAILHPAIRVAQNLLAARLGGAYQIHVVPLLVETHGEALYDRVLVIDCACETQLARLLQRDDISPQLAKQMMAAQASRAQRRAAADDVIDNSAPLAQLPEKIAQLHRHYLQLASPYLAE